MKSDSGTIVFCLGFLLLGAAASGPIVTHAATANTAVDDSPTVGALEEIVVTARKREENIEKAPLAISAFSASDLQQQTAINLPDIAKFTPSLVVAATTYDPFSAFVTIRGQGANDILLESEPSVGIYLDGVYVSNTLGTNVASLAGVERVEVLKGPQGTLYGRNTTGGAVSVVTAAPNYDGVSGSVKVRQGNFATTDLDGDINLPIIDHVLAARIDAGYLDQKDGFGHDLTTGRPLGNVRSTNLRAALRFDPTDQLEFMLRGDWSGSHSDGHNQQLAEVVPGSPATIEAGVEEALAGKLVSPAFSGAFLGALGPVLTGHGTGAQFATFGQGITQARSDMLALSSSGNPYNAALTGPPLLNNGVSLYTYGGSLAGTYDFGNELSLKSISAYRRLEREFDVDSDSTPFDILNSPNELTDQLQLSQEFDLNGAAFQDKLKYVLGLYYFHTRGYENQGYTALPAINPVNPNLNAGDVADVSRAGFGQATYALTDKLSLTGGLRYTSEAKSLVSMNTAGGECIEPIAAGSPCSATFDNRFHNVSYTASIDYAIDEQTLVYFRTGKGFKAGGQNERVNTTNDAFANFLPEVATDYEVGVKSDFANKRLRINADYYHTNYTDIQLTEIAAGPNGSPTSIIANAGAAKIDGVELEVQALPIDPLLLRATSSWINTRFTEGEPLYSSNRISGVPKFQASVAAVYTVATSIGDGKLGVNYTWQSLADYQADNHALDPTPTDPTRTTAGYTTQSAYGLLDARLSLDLAHTKTEIALYGKNLTNKFYFNGAIDEAGAGLGPVITFAGPPRTFGLELTQKF